MQFELCWVLTVYFSLYLNFLCYIFLSQFETQTRIKNPPDSLMSVGETRQPWCCCDVIKFIDKRPEDLRVYKQEARWCGRVTARSPTSWASPWSNWDRKRHQEYGSSPEAVLFVTAFWLAPCWRRSRTEAGLISLSYLLYIFPTSFLLFFPHICYYFSICHACIL